MSEEQQQPKVTIKGKEYLINELTENQQYMVAMLSNYEAKAKSMQDEVLVLQSGCAALVENLVKDIETPKDDS
jgi:hypothetical protein